MQAEKVAALEEERKRLLAELEAVSEKEEGELSESPPPAPPPPPPAAAPTPTQGRQAKQPAPFKAGSTPKGRKNAKASRKNKKNNHANNRNNFSSFNNNNKRPPPPPRRPYTSQPHAPPVQARTAVPFGYGHHGTGPFAMNPPPVAHQYQQQPPPHQQQQHQPMMHAAPVWPHPAPHQPRHQHVQHQHQQHPAPPPPPPLVYAQPVVEPAAYLPDGGLTAVDPAEQVVTALAQPAAMATLQALKLLQTASPATAVAATREAYALRLMHFGPRIPPLLRL